MKIRGPLDIAKVQGVYDGNIHKFEMQEEGESSSSSHRDRLIHMRHRISRIREEKSQVGASSIAIS